MTKQEVSLIALKNEKKNKQKDKKVIIINVKNIKELLGDVIN